MTVCLANRQKTKLFVEYNSTLRKKERTVRKKKARHGTERETGRTGRDAERVTHDATGIRRDEMELRLNSAQRSGENGTGGSENSGVRRATKWGNGTDEKETSSG